MCVLTFIKSQ